MRDATSQRSTCWRELYRCDDLRQARAVAACIGAMEFDVRLCSASVAQDDQFDAAIARRPGIAMPGRQDAETPSCAGALHICACNRIDRFVRDEEMPGPHIVEVPDNTWPQLADVLLEIIAEQQEFDDMLECRRQRHQVRLVLVLSITTAAEVMLIWRLLES